MLTLSHGGEREQVVRIMQLRQATSSARDVDMLAGAAARFEMIAATSPAIFFFFHSRKSDD
jgi:hypothetical protein